MYFNYTTSRHKLRAASYWIEEAKNMIVGVIYRVNPSILTGAACGNAPAGIVHFIGTMDIAQSIADRND